MVSVVNGYLCTCSCEAAKAKRGEDPHTLPGQTSEEADKAEKAKRDPAVILDGALKGAIALSGTTSPQIATQGAMLNRTA